MPAVPERSHALRRPAYENLQGRNRGSLRCCKSSGIETSPDDLPRVFSRDSTDQSGLAPENFTTLAHFSVSSAISLPKAAAEPGSTVPPRSASRALSLE